MRNDYEAQMCALMQKASLKETPPQPFPWYAHIALLPFYLGLLGMWLLLTWAAGQLLWEVGKMWVGVK